MCVVADEIEEDGSNDASGADGAKRQRVGDASGGASGFEDGGGVRNGDELSADDLTQLAACDDVGLDLTEKESALLVAKRRACATRERQHGLSAMQGAQLHGFRLVRRDGQVTVECLLCQKQGFEAQSGRYFLNNYLNWHVGKDREHAQLAAAAREMLCSVSSAGAAKPFEAAAKPCEAPEPHEAAEPPVNATPHVSVSLCVASTRTTRSGATWNISDRVRAAAMGGQLRDGCHNTARLGPSSRSGRPAAHGIAAGAASRRAACGARWLWRARRAAPPA